MLARSTSVEAFLIKKGVPFRFLEKVPLDQIDYAKSRHNQARFSERTLPETVEDYALKMIDGEDFPGVIVYCDDATGKFILADGLHRYAAAMEAELPALDAYVMDKADRLIIDIVTRTVNRGHGLNLARGDSLEQALYFMDHHGYTLERAAAEMSLAPAHVESYLRARRTSLRLAQLNVPVHKFSWPIVAELGLIESDVVIALAASAVRNLALSEGDTRVLVRRVVAQRSEAGAAAAIEHEIEARQKLAKRTNVVRRPIAMAFKQSLSRLANHLRDNPSRSDNQLTDEEMNEVDGLWRQIVRGMEFLLGS